MKPRETKEVRNSPEEDVVGMREGKDGTQVNLEFQMLKY